VNSQNITLAIIATLSASIAVADDFKTTEGKEYKNATVNHVEPDGIVVRTKSGISKIYFTELPKEVQQRFNYDPNKATAYSAAEQNAANEQNRKQQEEATGQAKQSAQEQATIQRNVNQVQNVQALQDTYLALQQQEASLSQRIGDLQKLPEQLSEHSRTGNRGWRHQYVYDNPARADLPALRSRLAAVRKEKGEVEKQLKQAQH
jgi:hypothetical protein